MNKKIYHEIEPESWVFKKRRIYHDMFAGFGCKVVVNMSVGGFGGGVNERNS